MRSIAATAGLVALNQAAADEPVQTGSRRELIVDSWMVHSLDGARQQLHRPVPQEVVVTYDERQEGNSSSCGCNLKDGDTYC